MQTIIGAAIFAAGCLFGAWLILAGQASQKNKASQKIQDALLKSIGRAGSEPENH